MRWLAVALAVGGCAVGSRPESGGWYDEEDPSVTTPGGHGVEEADPTDGCRGCSSSTTTWPIEAYTVEMEILAPDASGPLAGTFYGSVLAADDFYFHTGPPLIQFTVELDLEDAESIGEHSVDVFGPTNFVIRGFLDIDENADPARPHRSRKDPRTRNVSEEYAYDGIGEARVILSVP